MINLEIGSLNIEWLMKKELILPKGKLNIEKAV